MFRLKPVTDTDQKTRYESIKTQMNGLLAGERSWLPNTANFSSLIFHLLPELNWAGFYFFDGDQLVLGPFQGKPACTRIDMGQGVCGTAARSRTTQRVEDVHLFPGHIACDPDSRSELVIPLVTEERLLGLLDLDSPIAGRFDATDEQECEALVKTLLEATDWPHRF